MSKNKVKRIVIDTNLWVSFLISNSFYKIDELLVANNITILFSKELLDEIGITITKPKLKRYFPSTAMEDMLNNLENYIELISVTSLVKICRDSNDDFLLSLCKDGKADYLLTGDKDLLHLSKFEKTNVITIAAFIAKYQ